jgi:hypothetical protein
MNSDLLQTDEEIDAYEEGVQALKNEASLDENPYIEDDLSKAWLLGYFSN